MYNYHNSEHLKKKVFLQISHLVIEMITFVEVVTSG